MTRLQSLLSMMSQRQDLGIVAFFLLVIALMVLPLPTWLMDVMIAINIMVALLFVMLAVTLKNPLEFSTLPSAILIATLIRIAITIATSRLILLQADAGEVIQSFGSFVIAGNVVVGLVIFAIIAIAQFVVITRGAERVAEVGARFALDALPGKQMSIDSDLRAGDIDRHEARRRRQDLEHQSQYYGAMDGAMKFVKGDAILSMIIIFVNLVGGVMVGSLMRGMDVGTAFSTYALLTVGDGLASQIPALLVAVAAGIVVTRVTSEQSETLGVDMARELVSSAQSLAVVAVALFLMGLIPGFPTPIFAGLGLLATIGAIFLWRARERRTRAAAEEAAREAETTAAADGVAGAAPLSFAAPKPGDAFALAVGADLRAALEGSDYSERLEARLAAERTRLGAPAPAPGLIAATPDLEPDQAAFFVDGAEMWRDRFPIDLQFAPRLALGGAAAPEGVSARLMGLGDGLWLPAAEAARLAEPTAAVSAPGALAEAVGASAGRWSARAFGLEAVDAWMTRLSSEGMASLVDLIRQTVPLTRTTEVMRLLLDEGVPLTHPRLALEALLDQAPRVDDNALLTDMVRLQMARPISAMAARPGRRIVATVAAPALENHLRMHIQETPTGARLALDHAEAEAFSAALSTEIRRHEQDGAGQPWALATSFDIRRSIATFAAARGLRITVIAHDEIAIGYGVEPARMLDLDALEPSAAAASAAYHDA